MELFENNKYNYVVIMSSVQIYSNEYINIIDVFIYNIATSLQLTLLYANCNLLNLVPFLIRTS